MPKIRIHYEAKVYVSSEIEVSDEELNSMSENSIPLSDSGLSIAFFREKGFSNNAICIGDSYIDAGHTPRNSYEVISRANSIKNITEFSDPYLENIVFEEVN